jgi:hypothetical protein
LARAVQVIVEHYPIGRVRSIGTNTVLLHNVSDTEVMSLFEYSMEVVSEKA